MTYKESIARLEAVKAETRLPLEEARKEWRSANEAERAEIVKKYIAWDKEHNAKVAKAFRAIVPEEGIGVTIILWSDLRAATVTRVISPSKIAVKHNKTICIDYFAGEYEILPEIDETFDEQIFTKRSNGFWVAEGQKLKDGVKLSLLYQRHYIDPSF